MTTGPAVRELISRWRTAAHSLRENNPLWSSHFYDCANELSKAIEKDDAPDDSFTDPAL